MGPRECGPNWVQAHNRRQKATGALTIFLPFIFDQRSSVSQRILTRRIRSPASGAGGICRRQTSRPTRAAPLLYLSSNLPHALFGIGVYVVLPEPQHRSSLAVQHPVHSGRAPCSSRSSSSRTSAVESFRYGSGTRTKSPRRRALQSPSGGLQSPNSPACGDTSQT